MRELVALERFEYDGKALGVGDRFAAVSDSDAETLIAHGRAQAHVEPQSPAPTRAKRRNEYRRTDMRAED